CARCTSPPPPPLFPDTTLFRSHRKEVMWGGRPLVLETGKIARQADGAVMITYGGTQVLCTVVAEKAPKPGNDFFPLTVNYQEKADRKSTRLNSSHVKISYAVFC